MIPISVSMLQFNFHKYIKPFVDDVCSDVLGNVIAHRPGKGERLMLIAHRDVVCLMITYIDSNGFLYVKPAGGIDSSLLPARKVLIKHGNSIVTGIIGKKPIHLMSEDSATAKVAYENLWIDIGARNQAEALSKVSLGDYAYFCTEEEEMPNNLLFGSYLDDKVGLKILLRLAEQLQHADLPWDIFYVASNYEEIGMRGAAVAANKIHPDACICIDATHATDYPTMNIMSYGDIRLGQGCVLAKGPNIYGKLLDGLEETARTNGVKYQIEVSPYQTGTDANIIQLTGKGVKTAVVSIPCRYMHTPYEVCSNEDIDGAVKIIGEFIQKHHSY